MFLALSIPPCAYSSSRWPSASASSEFTAYIYHCLKLFKIKFEPDFWNERKLQYMNFIQFFSSIFTKKTEKTQASKKSSINIIPIAWQCIANIVVRDVNWNSQYMHFSIFVIHSTMRKQNVCLEHSSFCWFFDKISTLCKWQMERFGFWWHFSFHFHSTFPFLIRVINRPNRISFDCKAFYDTTMNSVTHASAINSEWHVWRATTESRVEEFEIEHLIFFTSPGVRIDWYVRCVSINRLVRKSWIVESPLWGQTTARALIKCRRRNCFRRGATCNWNDIMLYLTTSCFCPHILADGNRERMRW